MICGPFLPDEYNFLSWPHDLKSIWYPPLHGFAPGAICKLSCLEHMLLIESYRARRPRRWVPWQNWDRVWSARLHIVPQHPPSPTVVPAPPLMIISGSLNETWLKKEISPCCPLLASAPGTMTCFLSRCLLFLRGTSGHWFSEHRTDTEPVWQRWEQRKPKGEVPKCQWASDMTSDHRHMLHASGCHATPSTTAPPIAEVTQRLVMASDGLAIVGSNVELIASLVWGCCGEITPEPELTSWKEAPYSCGL